ncbi:helix-turn-helix domain-containing protein [Allosalinactinospora lopnorensis]|uniref:helix-turn-helix domain-containing protein n=1 Tax=Allosalinactinospora lopnorensis TaxID=1352348 RepID=UPI000623C0C9|nr:helix-turn-helix transcriptional regulator [Allosalinactinospora lopnorensis]
MRTRGAPDGTPAHRIGPVIKDLRKSLGWSQSHLATALGRAAGAETVTREHVSRWESGRVCPSAHWLRHLATVLQVPLETLNNIRVDRRTFLTDIAGVAIAPAVAADLIEAGFAAALRGDGPSQDDWEAAVETYGRDYMTSGAAEIQKRLAADLVVLQQQLDASHSWSIAAKLATLYAKTFPGSDGAKAVTWYRHAAAFADRANDETARVWVRGRAAIALGYEGAALGVADTLASQALQLDDRPSLGRVNAIMGKAHVAALRGDRATALALVDEGRRVFDHAGSDDAETDYAVPWWRFNVFISLLGARLGEERLAMNAQEEAGRSLPPSLPRFKTHLEMHRGLMLARVGSPYGVGHAQDALNALPPEKHSLTLRMLMEEIRAA